MRVVCDAVLLLYLVAAWEALMSWVAELAACLAADSSLLISFLFMADVAAVFVALLNSSAAVRNCSCCRSSRGDEAQP